MTTILELTSANKTNNKATNNKLQREGENEYPPAKRSKTDDEEEPTVVGNGTIVGAPKQQTLSGVNVS